MESLISSNTCLLDQSIALLDALDTDLYTERVESFYGSTLGGHLRHCLEHYQSFVNGIESGKIDYDARVRDESVEHDPVAARACAQSISQSLTLDLLNRSVGHSVEVNMDCGADCVGNWQGSSLGRELQFLVSHTVHHFAMMKGMCTALGVDLPEGFGMAPSTLRHLATCAS